MRKLNQKKVRWIIREMDRGVSSRLVAGVQKVSVRRVQQLYNQYQETGQMPELYRCGRKTRVLTSEETNIILKAYTEYQVNALALERVINRYYNIHIPHNQIHKVLKQNQKARDEPHKQKQRKWVRYERKHSLSLVHADWHEHGDTQLIAILDDASRMILAAGEYDSANIDNGLLIIKKAVQEAAVYGPIKQLLTDNGSEFSSHWRTRKKDSTGRFQDELEKHEIQHIRTSVNHPQTNGKLEKWFDLYEKKHDDFKTLEKLIGWYNHKRPHMSLDFKNAETPAEAYTRKMRPEYLLHAASKHFKW